MMERVVELAQSVDRLSLRERLFLLAAGLFVMGGLWEAVLAAPLALRERLANDKVTALQERLPKLDESLNLAAAGASEGVPGQLERLRALREAVQAREEDVRVFTTDLVGPTEMRLVLEELLRRQGGLTLLRAVNRPAEPVVEDEEREASPPAPPAAGAESDAPKLYRHSLVLELSADEYPTNDITIELTTLSLDEEWIGV